MKHTLVLQLLESEKPTFWSRRATVYYVLVRVLTCGMYVCIYVCVSLCV